MKKTLVVTVCLAFAVIGGRVCAEDAVLASKFGWNATNATKCLQAAFDSGARKVIVDRQAGDWIVNQVFIRSNQEVVIADGTMVRALKGAFHDPNHRLVNLIGVTNAVLRGIGSARLRMEREDYTDRSKYVFSEWRHGIFIGGWSKNVTVRDLDVGFSGGDGVYVCDSTDVTIENVNAHDHYRLGMAVTGGVRGLTIRRCRFCDTRGTPPNGGFDFEPNDPNGYLVNCLVEDCFFDGSAYGAFFTHFVMMDATTEPISITLRRCEFSGRGGAGHAVTATFSADMSKSIVRGKVLFDGCRITANNALLAINGKTSDTELVFRDCTFDATGKDFGIVLNNRGLSRDFAGVRFENSKLMTEAREPIVFHGKAGAGVEDVGGSLDIVRSSGTTRFDFAGFLASHRPDPAVAKMMRPMPVDALRLKPVAAGGDAGRAYPMARGSFTFLQYAPKAGEYAVTFRSRQLGRKRAFKIPVSMRDRVGTALGSFDLTGAVQRVVFRTEGTNVRFFDVKAWGYAVSVVPECAGHGVMLDEMVNFFCGTHRLYFTVPAEAEDFILEVVPEEPVEARLLNANGEVVDKMPRTTETKVFRHRRKAAAQAEVWSLAVRADEDFSIRCGAGVLPIVSTSAASLLCQ